MNMFPRSRDRAGAASTSFLDQETEPDLKCFLLIINIMNPPHFFYYIGPHKKYTKCGGIIIPRIVCHVLIVKCKYREKAAESFCLARAFFYAPPPLPPPTLVVPSKSSVTLILPLSLPLNPSQPFFFIPHSAVDPDPNPDPVGYGSGSWY
jgi:hypothetical protein